MNTFLITIDSLRADAVGYASQGAVDTPYLDRFAGRALKCSNAQANAPYTVASFPAILTGTYPWMYGGYGSVSRARPSLAARFREAGYDTGGFHSNPYLDARFGYSRGFEAFYDSEHAISLYTKLQQRLKEALPSESVMYRVLRGLKNLAERHIGGKVGLPYLPAEDLTDITVSWLDNSDTPAFGWIHYMDVHNPYLPHDGCQGSSVTSERALDLHHRMIENPESLDKNDVDTLRTLYHGEVEYLDRQIGRLLSAIDTRWGLEETVVVIVSDHGEGFGQWGYYSHVVDCLHDDLLRIPMLLSIPGKPTNLLEAPTSTVDLVPTLLSLSDISIPEECVGTDLTGELPADRFIYAHAGDRDDGRVMADDGVHRLVRSTASGEETLYRRKGDYSETPVSPSDNRQIISELSSALDDHLAMVDANQAASLEVEIDPKVEERLDQLGYR